jgi:hypothetical protein
VKKTFLMMLCLCATADLRAAAGTEGAAFLQIPVGAGPAALGSAYSALAVDAYAPIYNPAGLGFLDTIQVAGQHLAYLESIRYEQLSAVFPLGQPKATPEPSPTTRLGRWGALGLSAQYLTSGDIAGRDSDDNPTPDYSTQYGAYTVAWGHHLGRRLAIGLASKLITAKISDVSSNAFAIDLGALYNFNTRTTLAATIHNIGNKLTFLNDDSSLPMTSRLGLAWRPGSQWLTVVQGELSKQGAASAHMGLEWRPLQLFSLRVGYRTDTTPELGAMAGLSVGTGIHVWGQEFAYAWLPYGDLGNSQYFSLVGRFGETIKDRHNLIQRQNIKRHWTADTDYPPEHEQMMQLLTEPDPAATAQTPDKNSGAR